MTITHTKVSAIADGADATLVRPSDWNATHAIAAPYMLLRKKTITLTHAQILTLPSTPVAVVPATETLNYSGLATQMPMPILATIRFNTAGGIYTNFHSDARFVICIGSDISWDFMRSPALNIASTGSALFYQSLPLHFTTLEASPADPHVHTLNFMNSGENLDGGLYDNALCIALHNLNGNLLAGHVDNFMKITIVYDVIDL